METPAPQLLALAAAGMSARPIASGGSVGVTDPTPLGVIGMTGHTGMYNTSCTILVGVWTVQWTYINVTQRQLRTAPYSTQLQPPTCPALPISTMAVTVRYTEDPKMTAESKTTQGDSTGPHRGHRWGAEELY